VQSPVGLGDRGKGSLAGFGQSWMSRLSVSGQPVTCPARSPGVTPPPHLSICSAGNASVIPDSGGFLYPV